MARRVLAPGLVLVVLVATGCSRPEADDVPAGPVRDLGAQQVFRHQVYAQRDTGALRLDLFVPPRRGVATPLVVYVHGGGWDAGVRTLDADASAPEAPAAQRLWERGYAVATVDYRLSGVARSPAQVVDVADAVRWLQARSARWGLDPDRALWGASAGGHLVSQLGMVAGDPAEPGGGLTGIRAVVDWFGPSDLSAEAQHEHPRLQDYVRRAVAGLLGCLPVDCPDVADAASSAGACGWWSPSAHRRPGLRRPGRYPVRNVSGDEPPFLIQQGTADSLVPLDQSLDFAETLRSSGVTAEVHPYQGLDHGFGVGPQTALVVDTLDIFVRTHV
ncbi:alpha/beta hydrolase [Saccharopolyspora rhizosphaerae]|uniref:Alpha/beta hydrolase n=1 Tax=Saccharopolyspora rhizosphaerae TaxID=2492662 RepID=A0A426JQW6_9PSEU|nr:alpha/beta hydrolase [Saccharopolyspora rhizosphaerae]RRO15544.1 alpha/beta hydrolase [Saccharopolyspora rhizosphaerae]